MLGLPRGGVVVAHEMAHALQAPLDVWVVRKIGSPLQPELAIGAISSVSSPSPICGRSKRLRGPAELAIVPGATHLFEEPA